MNSKALKGACVFVAVAVGAVGLFLLGAASVPRGSSAKTDADPHAAHRAAAKTWTCSMHPQIRMDRPGDCPICGMDLIPAETVDADGRTVALSDAARKAASIETAAVGRRALTYELRAVGRVESSEPLTTYVSARADGRVERVYADFTGVDVRAGDHLVDLYSPDLIVAQDEYLAAGRAAKAAGGASDSWAAQRRLARQKLLLLGVTEEQLARLDAENEARLTLTAFAPRGGTVMTKNVREGMYVKAGDPLYVLADLSTVWVLVDVYEFEAAWVALGRRVRLELEGAPGADFVGRVAFIDPMVNDATRTIRVRVEVSNPDRRLKPGMFAKAVIEAELTADGRAAAAQDLGAHYCRMHPGVRAERPGDCPICGMRLESRPTPASRPEDETAPAPLAVPESAVLSTGVRRVVYVERGEGRFESVAVTLGPKAGAWFPLLAGLEEGDRIVTRGAFLLDSQSQIEGKPSLLFPNGLAGPPATGHVHGDGR